MNKTTLHIAEPCHESWDGMHGDDEKRFCDSCSKHVHHLSGMTRRAARALLVARRDEGLCVRYAHDAEGSLLFRSRRVSATAPRAQVEGAARLVARAALVASVFGACGWPVAEASELAGGLSPIEMPLQGEPALPEPKPEPEPPKCEGEEGVEGSGQGREAPLFMGMAPELMGDVALPPGHVIELQEDAAAEQLEPFGITLDEEEHVCEGEGCEEPEVGETWDVIQPFTTQPEVMGRMPPPDDWKPGY